MASGGCRFTLRINWTAKTQKSQREGKRVKGFILAEFACPCCDMADMESGFLFKIQDARHIANVPFNITSGYRCRHHNGKPEVGGSPTSSHLTGCAADIACSDSATRERILHGLIEAGFRRIGVGQSFIHCDTDSRKAPAVWLYSSK